MDKLIEKLNEFNLKRTELIVSNKWNENNVAECFKPCAYYILRNGYFMINGKYIIDLGSIELYYHEEDGTIKDHIMYHTNEHHSKSKIYELNEGYPYFKFGSFNLHQSGVDVTFENSNNPNDKYRASFLIRSYRVLQNEKDIDNKYIEYDPYSTHIFDDMFYSGVLLNSDNRTMIEWIEYDKSCEIEQHPRRNVAMYQENGDKIEVTKSQYEVAYKAAKEKGSYPECFKYGNKYYLQDMRLWQFSIKGIKEKK